MSGFSNWREEFNLSEVVTGKMTDDQALKKVSEKKGINNKVVINPKLDEAVKEIGGEVISMTEADTTAQKQRIDMKQMILDRQKLKIRRKDLSQKKREGEDVDSTNASKQADIIAQEETIKQVNEKKRKNALQIQKVIGEGDVHSGQGEKIQSRTLAWMKKRGEKGAPGLDAMKARTAEHKAKRGVKEEVIAEKDLNAAERRALPNKDFALPGKGKGPEGKQAGSYPIPDEKHARSALSLVAQHGTPEEKATVRAKVKKKFPEIQQEGVMKFVKSIGKKKEKKAEKAMDAGARAKRMLARKVHAKYVSGSEDIVPDDIREADDKAYKYVVSQLKKKYGDDAVLTKGQKPKPPTAAQQKKNAEIRAKRAKEDHRDPTEIASSGRYSDRYSNRGSD